MPAPTFHPFRRLPAELRLLIWELALRPRGGGVHYFSIADMRKPAADNPLRQLAIPDPEDEDEVDYAVSAPVVRNSDGQYSWTTGNRSVYLWDVGLWTACKESRSVIRKRFLRPWDAPRYHQRVHTKPSRGSGSEGEQNTGLKLVFDPDTDLFCLDLHDFDLGRQSIDSTPDPHIDWATLLCDVPFPVDAFATYETHVALEFDPSWVVHLPQDAIELVDEPTPRGFAAQFLIDCIEHPEMDACHLWLIDRDLRLSKTALKRADDGSEAAFYDLEERRYLALDEGDLEEGLPHDWEYKRSSLFFVDWVASTGAVFYNHILRGILGEEEEFKIKDHLRVLACV